VGQQEALDVVCGLIERGGLVLLAQRARGKSQGGLWEFPGGKLERGEEARAGLERELREELGVRVIVGEALSPRLHRYGARVVRLLPFRCVLAEGEPEAHEHEALRWCLPQEAEALELVPADRPVLTAYMLGLAGGD